MSTFPETPDMFLQVASRSVEATFTQLTPLEQVRVLRQLLMDLSQLPEKHWQNIFQYRDFVDTTAFWLDVIQQETPAEKSPTEPPESPTATDLKTTYEEIKSILLDSSVAIAMRWRLYSQLLELYVHHLQSVGLTLDQIQMYVRNLKEAKVLVS